MKENEKEKMVEEIASRIRKATTGPVLKGDGDRGLAKELIARIGKACADGEMELPREEVRTKELSIDEYHRLLWRGCTFIALRPEEEE